MKREKALDVIRSIYTTDAEKEALQTLIPELKEDEEKESDDERIRKGLILHLAELRDWKVGTLLPIKASDHYNKWIAWLEKREEEHKLVKWSDEDKKMIEAIIEDYRDLPYSILKEEVKSRCQVRIDFLERLKDR